jgi:formylglycine-generating enzyme
MARHGWPIAGALIAFATGCGGEVDPRAQWVIQVTTDAKVPELGDRLLVEVLDGGGSSACADSSEPLLAEAVGCRRSFAVAAESDWPVSFGVASIEAGSGLRLRAVLYRNGYVDERGLPRSPSRIELTARLPEADGVTQVTVPLAMSCFGIAGDLSAAQTCDPATGVSGPEPQLVAGGSAAGDLVVGSWPPAARVPCPTAPPSGMVCIPGGAFLLGDFRTAAFSLDLEAAPERLVTLSPFFLDAREATVADVLSLEATLGETPIPYSPNPEEPNHPCAYLSPALDAEQKPANCVSYELAERACEAWGKRLPTEAEWEYAASGAGRESSFAWGEASTSDEICLHAVVGRGRTDFTGGLDEDTSCRSIGGESFDWGPTAAGHERDRSAEGVFNLAGNVAEWVRGALASYGEGCWAGGDLLVDPVCTGDDPTTALPAHAVRGASWLVGPLAARSATRGGGQAAHPARGFRCAR